MTNDTVDNRRLRFVLATMGISLAGFLLNAWIMGGWKVATGINLAVDLLLIGYTVHTGDRLLRRLLALAAVASVIELLVADPWFINRGILFYVPGGPFLFESPLYMPLGWIFVLVQLGTIAEWLNRRWGLASATLLSGILGGINIPIYEQLAKSGRLWYYEGCPAVLSTPYFVIGSELLVGLSLPWLVARMAKGGFAMAMFLGVPTGLWIWIAGLIGFKLLC